MKIIGSIGGGVLALALAAAGAAQAQVSRPAPTLSPDGLQQVWTESGCHCLWSARRASAQAPWSAPEKLFEIRGAIGRVAWSPDGARVAFENPRGDWTVEAARGSPAMQGFSPPRSYGWGFIGVYDVARRRLGFVDPSFATDTDPKWESPVAISFTRHAENAADARLTRPAPALEAGTTPVAPGSAAAYFAAPLAYQPIVSADGRLAAFVSIEGATRAVNLLPLDGQARRFAVFEGDDGQALSDIALAPHGEAVAFVRGAFANKLGDIPNPHSLGEKPAREIWLGGAHGAPRKVADGEEPQFTPDGGSLIWATERGLVIAPLLHEADGGVGLGAASELIHGAGEAHFSPDGSKLVYPRGDGLYVYDLASDLTTAVERPKGAVDFDVIWSPDGTRIAFVRSNQTRDAGYTLGFDGPFVAKEPWSIQLFDIAAKSTREVWRAKPGVGSAFYQLDEDATGTGREGDQLYWSADDRIVFSWEGDGWRHLYSVPAAGGEATLLTAGDGEIETVAQTLDRTRLIVATNIGDLGRRHLASVDVASATIAPLTPGKLDQWGPAPMAGGALAYVEAGWASPPQIRLRSAAGAVTASALPAAPAALAKSWVEPRLVELKAEDGGVAYGQLFVPQHPSGCGVVFAHGGIKRQMLPGFHYMDAYSVLYETNQYLASRGCAVLSVEYRSSIMRGHAFRNASGWGSAGASEMLDVAAAGRYLKTDPRLKVRHVGVYGLSWGGYITAQSLARYPDLFEAGFDMAGVHEFFGDRAQHSPEAEIGAWRAPVYLIQGDDDRNVDFYQGLSLAALLRKQGVDATFRAVPDEVHDMTSTFANTVDVYGSGADYLLQRLAPGKGPGR